MEAFLALSEKITAKLRQEADAFSVLANSSAKRIIQKKLRIESGTLLQTYEKNARDDALRKLKASGLSVRQIERLTGINRGVISKA